MNLKELLYKGLVVSAITMTAACSDDYLEQKPSAYLDEEDVTSTMQEDPSQVQAYVTGAYLNFYCGGDYWTNHDDFGLPAIKLATDLMCDDVAYPNDNHFFCYDYQLDNRQGNYRRTSSMWNQLYTVIDNTNTIITMLKPAEGEEPANDDAKVMLGQAYSLRAYCYFWLINLWQHPYSAGTDQLGVPLKTETEYRQERVSVGEIYDQILSDIATGYGYLEGEGFIDSDKGSLSEYAAAAIYANALMFTGDYTNAAKYAKIAAESTSLNSESDMLGGFNSLTMPEVIWGYNVTNETTGYYASLFSHIDTYMIGYGGQVGYRKMIASELYDQISDTDIRKQWFGYNEDYNLLDVSYSYEQANNYLPYLQNKFRDAYMTGAGDPFTSAIIYFRSGEMYFVAAEAYYLAGDEGSARDMLNTVMATRIPSYACTKSGEDLYQEICLQKRIETWLEGDRYLDVKRRNETIDRSKSVNHAVDLSSTNAINYTGRDYRMIYHIPTSEMENNPSITTNDDNE